MIFKVGKEKYLSRLIEKAKKQRIKLKKKINYQKKILYLMTNSVSKHTDILVCFNLIIASNKDCISREEEIRKRYLHLASLDLEVFNFCSMIDENIKKKQEEIKNFEIEKKKTQSCIREIKLEIFEHLQKITNLKNKLKILEKRFTEDVQKNSF
jgi:hypothetical protein